MSRRSWVVSSLVSRPETFCWVRSEEHTSELQSLRHLVCRLLLGETTLRPRISTLFPYTTLFRSGVDVAADVEAVLGGVVAGQPPGDFLLGLGGPQAGLADVVQIGRAHV